MGTCTLPAWRHRRSISVCLRWGLWTASARNGSPGRSMTCPSCDAPSASRPDIICCCLLRAMASYIHIYTSYIYHIYIYIYIYTYIKHIFECIQFEFRMYCGKRVYICYCVCVFFSCVCICMYPCEYTRLRVRAQCVYLYAHACVKPFVLRMNIRMRICRYIMSIFCMRVHVKHAHVCLCVSMRVASKPCACPRARRQACVKKNTNAYTNLETGTTCDFLPVCANTMHTHMMKALSTLDRPHRRVP
jgi:hypothetical protein